MVVVWCTRAEHEVEHALVPLARVDAELWIVLHFERVERRGVRACAAAARVERSARARASPLVTRSIASDGTCWIKMTTPGAQLACVQACARVTSNAVALGYSAALTASRFLAPVRWLADGVPHAGVRVSRVCRVPIAVRRAVEFALSRSDAALPLLVREVCCSGCSASPCPGHARSRRYVFSFIICWMWPIIHRATAKGELGASFLVYMDAFGLSGAPRRHGRVTLLSRAKRCV